MSRVVRGRIILGPGVVGEVNSCGKQEDLAPSHILIQHSVFYESPSLDESLDAVVGLISQGESTDSGPQGRRRRMNSSSDGQAGLEPHHSTSCCVVLT